MNTNFDDWLDQIRIEWYEETQKLSAEQLAAIRAERIKKMTEEYGFKVVKHSPMASTCEEVNARALIK
jgi:hypothetical protein